MEKQMQEMQEHYDTQLSAKDLELRAEMASHDETKAALKEAEEANKLLLRQMKHLEDEVSRLDAVVSKLQTELDGERRMRATINRLEP